MFIMIAFASLSSWTLVDPSLIGQQVWCRSSCQFQPQIFLDAKWHTVPKYPQNGKKNMKLIVAKNLSKFEFSRIKYSFFSYFSMYFGANKKNHGLLALKFKSILYFCTKNSNFLPKKSFFRIFWKNQNSKMSSIFGAKIQKNIEFMAQKLKKNVSIYGSKIQTAQKVRLCEN